VRGLDDVGVNEGPLEQPIPIGVEPPSDDPRNEPWIPLRNLSRPVRQLLMRF
jgi:hypothetical protein